MSCGDNAPEQRSWRPLSSYLKERSGQTSFVRGAKSGVWRVDPVRAAG